MPYRNRNKDMGKEAAAPLGTEAAMAMMVVNLFHRKKAVEVEVWTQNSKILVVAVG